METYLTDYREYSLKDVITQLEPQLFKKVTGLEVNDFELLVSLNVFNEALMNDAVYKFKRYEDSSLSYTGIDRHRGERVGLFSTSLKREEYEAMAGQLAAAEVAPKPQAADLQIAQYYPEGEDAKGWAAARKNELTKQISMRNESPVAQEQKTKSVAAVLPAAKESCDKNNVQNIAIGDTVVHKAFGTGTVIGTETGKITVSFNGAEKKFQFPGAFMQGFLKKQK